MTEFKCPNCGNKMATYTNGKKFCTHCEMTCDRCGKEVSPIEHYNGEKFCHDCVDEMIKGLREVTTNVISIGDTTNFEPILQFTSQEQLDASLKEWQHKLGLDNWNIRAELTNVIDSDRDGEAWVVYIHKCASIKIRKEDLGVKLCGTVVEKNPAEMVVIHELLHCYIDDSEIGDNAHYHTLVNTLAKALITAKYGLTLEWFKN